jgi:hypothetical protein
MFRNQEQKYSQLIVTKLNDRRCLEIWYRSLIKRMI